MGVKGHSLSFCPYFRAKDLAVVSHAHFFLIKGESRPPHQCVLAIFLCMADKLVRLAAPFSSCFRDDIDIVRRCFIIVKEHITGILTGPAAVQVSNDQGNAPFFLRKRNQCTAFVARENIWCLSLLCKLLAEIGIVIVSLWR